LFSGLLGLWPADFGYVLSLVMIAIIREGAERGQFQIKDQRPRDVAMQILAGAQGALMIGRLTGDAHAIDAVTTEFRNYLGYVPTK